jgi:Family of unknown function (DUF5372)
VGTISDPVRVTHPFHPLKGKKIAAVYRRINWGEDRFMYLRRSDKRPRSIPASWTDIVPEDEFRRTSRGRAAFRSSDLVELSALIERLAAGLPKRRVRKRHYAA